MKCPVWRGLLLTALALTGCESFNGPSLDYTAPRVHGRVRDAAGRPVAFAQVGRRLWKWRTESGDFRKGGEELLLRQDYDRTAADGSFTLPARQVALLFSWGEVPLNLRLTVQRGGYRPWQTNFPVSALSTNSSTPELDAGDVGLQLR